MGTFYPVDAYVSTELLSYYHSQRIVTLHPNQIASQN